MSMAYIRKAYGVPAKRGLRVCFTGGREPRFGTITSAAGSHLRIRLDGEDHPAIYHPTWKLEYLEAGRG